MRMHVEFLQGTRQGRSFELLPSSSTTDLAGEYILERDAVILTLCSEVPLENVVLHVGGYDLISECVEKPDQTYYYTWRPKYTARHRYEALFHNFFGIAQLFVGYTRPGDHQRHYYAYQPIEVMATKLTAERTESMVSFITDNNDEGVLNAISPTHLQANLVRNGVAPGELLAMLEETVQKTYGLCRPIIRNPMKRLRNKLQTQYGTDCQISDDQGMGWMLDNLSVLYPVSDPDNALLEHAGHWYAATEIQSSTPYESTNIYENQLIHLFLSKLRRQAERIIEGLVERQKKFVPRAVAPEGYVSFFAMMQRSVGRTTEAEVSRACACIHKIEELMLMFRHKVPADPWRVRNVQVTERIKVNKHYLHLMAVMKQWFTEREIDWQQLNFLASINSTPKLFEIYCCLNLNNYLRSRGEDNNIGKGLFCGPLDGKQVELHYEPNYWKSGHPAGNGAQYVNTDLHRVNHSIGDSPGIVRSGPNLRRSPDFVIEVAHGLDVDVLGYSLLVLDAKYMMETNVFENELHKCTMKYVHGIHSRRGEAVVKSLLLLHPDCRSSPGRYLSFHTSPHDINGSDPVFPTLGVQAMEVSNERVEQGLFDLLDTTMARLWPRQTNEPLLKMVG